MKSTNKMSKQRKLIFVFLLILGNAMMALLSFPSEPEVKVDDREVFRPDYINLRIKGVLKAELNPREPMTLLGERTRAFAKSVFILKQYIAKKGPESFLKNEQFEEFLVSVPRRQAEQILVDDVFAIYPAGVELKRKKRKSYEVIY